MTQWVGEYGRAWDMENMYVYCEVPSVLGFGFQMSKAKSTPRFGTNLLLITKDSGCVPASKPCTVLRSLSSISILNVQHVCIV